MVCYAFVLLRLQEAAPAAMFVHIDALRMFADAPVKTASIWGNEQPCKGRCSILNLVCLAFAGKKRHCLGFGGLLEESSVPPAASARQLQVSMLKNATNLAIFCFGVQVNCICEEGGLGKHVYQHCRCTLCNISIALG